MQAKLPTLDNGAEPNNSTQLCGTQVLLLAEAEDRLEGKFVVGFTPQRNREVQMLCRTVVELAFSLEIGFFQNEVLYARSKGHVDRAGIDMLEIG